jgi:glucuronoarabinoxylan endo-1,4-beta-xylanase
MQNIIVDFAKTAQEIDGFGVHGAFHQARNLRLFSAVDQQRILDVLFSTTGDGAGASIIRNIIGDSGQWGSEKDGPIPSIEPKEGLVNSQGDEDQIWFMGEAAKRGCSRFVSTAWSPPAWMKTTGDVANGGSLKAECYGDYAEYLARYVKLYQQAHGIVIYAISPSNEPDFAIHYSSCLWSGSQFADFYKNHLGPVFKREGITAKTFGPETTIFGNKILEEYSPFLLNREAGQALDILAMHGYPSSVIEKINDQFVLNRKIWMSEICDIGVEEYREFNPSMHDGLVVAKRIHDYLTICGVSAFLYFWGMSMYDNNAALIRLNLDDRTYVICKRAYALGHFSRFVRPGSVRVEVPSYEVDHLHLTAFRSSDDRAVIVAINDGQQDCEFQLELRNSSPPYLMPYTTNEDSNLSAGAPVSTAGGRVTVTVSAQSIVTFTG